jgi:hypothetical protein
MLAASMDVQPRLRSKKKHPGRKLKHRKSYVQDVRQALWINAISFILNHLQIAGKMIMPTTLMKMNNMYPCIFFSTAIPQKISSTMEWLATLMLMTTMKNHYKS